MQKPTKKTLYILISCILFLLMIIVAKNQTVKTTNLLSLETSSNEPTETSNESLEGLVTGGNTPQNNRTTIGDENITESFSKSLFAKYYSTGEGAELNNTDSQDLINQAVESFKTVGLENTTHYSFQDLKIVKSNEQNLRDFANTFAVKEEVCLANVRKVAQGTEDPIQTGNLYKKCASDFVAIPITQEINKSYLNLINTYYLMGEKIYSLEAAKSDPLKALIIMKEIGQIDTEKTNEYQNISNLIVKSGIIFSNEEPGKAWVGDTQ